MKMRKIAAIILAAAMAVASLAGCSVEKPANAATYNGGEINSGVYIFNQLSALNDAYSRISNPYLSSANILEQKIDDVTMEQWIIDRAAESTKLHAAIMSEANRLGVTLEADVLNSINADVDLAWENAGSYYDALGIEKQAAIDVTKLSFITEKLMQTYYGKGGEYEVPDEELKQYFDYNFRRSMMVVVSLVDNMTGAPLAEDQQAAARAAYAQYKDLISNGASILDVTYLELQRMNEMMGVTDPIPVMSEAQAEMLFYRNSISYPLGLSNMMFADGVEMNKPLFYEDGQYLVIFDVRELDKDGNTFEDYRPTLITALRTSDFAEKIEAVSETINFAPTVDLKKAFPVRAILMAQSKEAAKAQ